MFWRAVFVGAGKLGAWSFVQQGGGWPLEGWILQGMTAHFLCELWVHLSRRVYINDRYSRESKIERVSLQVNYADTSVRAHLWHIDREDTHVSGPSPSKIIQQHPSQCKREKEGYGEGIGSKHTTVELSRHSRPSQDNTTIQTFYRTSFSRIN